jgi:hypothetical protein
MRELVVVGALAIGCGAAPAPTSAQPPHEPSNLMSSDEFASRISGLRATLRRNHVEIDTVPVIDSCATDRYRDSKHDHCARCEVATRENTGGIDPDLIDGVAISFATYPAALIAASQLEHVALCRTIRIEGEPDEHPPAGIAITHQHRVLISVEQFSENAPSYKDFTIEQVVHHEVFHLFDYATSGDKVHADREWNALNPAGFAYTDPAASPGPQRPSGFVNDYATTDEVEDRATVFEYLLGQPAILCEIAHADPVVAAKTAVVWKRVAKVTGDKLLRRYAGCVDWIGRKPRPRPRPPRSGATVIKLHMP